MPIPNLVVVVIVISAAMFVGPPAIYLVHNIVDTTGLRNNNVRTLADAAIFAATYSALFAVAFSILGLPFGLIGTIAVFGILTTIEYFLPLQHRNAAS